MKFLQFTNLYKTWGNDVEYKISYSQKISAQYLEKELRKSQKSRNRSSTLNNRQMDISMYRLEGQMSLEYLLKNLQLSILNSVRNDIAEAVGL